MKVVYIKKICITANMPGKRQAKKHRKFGISWLMYIIQTRKVWFDVGYFNVVIYTVLY